MLFKGVGEKLEMVFFLSECVKPLLLYCTTKYLLFTARVSKSQSFVATLSAFVFFFS